MTDLPARLVHQAAAAIERDTLILHHRWEIEARAAVASVLDTLAEWQDPDMPPAHSAFWNRAELRALAREVREGT